jgi:hypothetical protein
MNFLYDFVYMYISFWYNLHNLIALALIFGSETKCDEAFLLMIKRKIFSVRPSPLSILRFCNFYHIYTIYDLLIINFEKNVLLNAVTEIIAWKFYVFSLFRVFFLEFLRIFWNSGIRMRRERAYPWHFQEIRNKKNSTF